MTSEAVVLGCTGLGHHVLLPPGGPRLPHLVTPCRTPCPPQVFRLAANGRRDTSSMCCCAVAVRPSSSTSTSLESRHALQDTAGASGDGGGGGGPQQLLQQLGYTAECSGLCPIGMQDIVLPPGV